MANDCVSQSVRSGKGRRSFAQLAASYSRYDFLVREIDQRMQDRFEFIRLQPELIVDLGCSCGGSFAGLGARYPGACLLGVDRESAMLKIADSAAVVVADAGRLPLAADTTGLVLSNLLLHWLDDPLPILVETQRILQTDGLFMFTTLGPDTLKELRAAFPDRYVHTRPFTDLHDWGDLLLQHGFSDPVMDREDITLTYDSFAALLAELRQSSARGVAAGCRRGLAPASFWRQVEAAYPCREGKWPATFEVIYGHAWKMQRTESRSESPLRFYRGDRSGG